MNYPYRVLFVCMGNICRSPTGEGIFRAKVAERGLAQKIYCDSAGTIDFHEGASPDERMRKAALAKGYSLTGNARPVRVEDFKTFDLIIAMDSDNHRNLLNMAPDESAVQKVVLMCQYCRRHSDKEVPDPYYGGSDGFRYVVELLEDSCEGLLDELSAKLL